MAAEQSTTPTLSQLRHELRTSLNHVLGYSEMILESASVSDDVEIQLLLHDIRTEAQNILRLVETCLSVTDETAPSVRLEDLHGQVRDPLHRLIRLSAALAHRSGDEILKTHCGSGRQLRNCSVSSHWDSRQSRMREVKQTENAR